MSTSSLGSSLVSTIARRARESVLLSGALKESTARPTERQELIRAYYAAALNRTAVADQLTDEGGAVAGLLLYREALPLLVAALALARDPDFSPPAADETLPPGASPWDVLIDLRRRGLVSALPANLDQARAALAAAGALAFDRLPAQTLIDRRTTVQKFMARLRRVIEPRSPDEIRGTRYIRIAGLAVLSLLPIWGLVSLFQPPNLALKKPVTASSRHRDSIAPMDNSWLTNGEIEQTYGIATAPGPSWVQIDLLSLKTISRVKIFDRRDTNPENGLPLTLELSKDNVTFTVAETRTQPFTSTTPWIYNAPKGTQCRYLRIRSNTYVVLSEVEVY